MYKKSKRFLAGFLALLLVVTMIPTDLLGVVYAAEETDAIVSEAFDSVDDAEEAEVLENANADDDADAEEALDENDIVKDGESAGASQPESQEGGDSSEAPAPSQPESTPQPSQPESTPQPSQPESSQPESTEPESSEPESTPSQPTTKDIVYKLDADAVTSEIEGFVEGSNTTIPNQTVGTNKYFTVLEKGSIGPVVLFSDLGVGKNDVNSADGGKKYAAFNWKDDIDGTKTANTIIITGGAMAQTATGYQNAIKFTTKTANAKVVVYAALKNTQSSGKLLINSTCNKSDTGADKAVFVSPDLGADADRAEITKFDNITVANPGTYYVGFTGGGGIVPYMTVTETVEVSETPDAPEAIPVSGSVLDEGTKVSLSVLDNEATIYYTTGATAGATADPTTAANKNTYNDTDKIAIDFNNKVIKAYAEKNGHKSDVATFTYSVCVAAPTATPENHVLGANDKITLTCTTADAPDAAENDKVKIYYTTDGSTPSTSSTLYTEPFSISSTSVIKAIATKTGWADSNVSVFTYIVPSTAKAEYIADGSAATLDAYFKCATSTSSNQSIGSDWPSDLDWSEYDISETAPTKVIRMTGGSLASAGNAVANGVYFTTSAPNTKVVIYHSNKGTVAGGVIQISKLTDDGKVGEDVTSAPSSHSKVTKSELTITEPGMYCIGFRGSNAGGGIIPYIVVTENPDGGSQEPATVADPAFDPNGATSKYTFTTKTGSVELSCETEGAVIKYVTNKGTNGLADADFDAVTADNILENAKVQAYADGTPIAVTESGTKIKAIAVYTKADTTVIKSTLVSAEYDITADGLDALDKPEATPAAGAVEAGTTVALNAKTGEDIYYTTDGTEPAVAADKTSVSGTKYTEAITVNEAVTIKAIAVKFSDAEPKTVIAVSPVEAFAYTIQTAPTEYTVIFKNGSETVDTKTVAEGESLDLSTVSFTVPTGKMLTGWNDGTKTYLPADTLTVTGNMTLTAVLEDAKTYTVTLMNGDTKIADVVGKEGEMLDLTEYAPKAEEGKVFLGWATEKDATEEEYGNIIKSLHKNMTLFAVIINEADVMYTVTYYDYFHEGMETTEKVKPGTEITLPDPGTHSGYTFKYWYNDVDDKQYKANDKYIVKSDVEFSQEWDEIPVPTTGMDVRVNDVYYQGGAAVLPDPYDEDILVYYKGNELTYGVDYTMKGKNNKNAGTATLTVTGIGNYKGVKKDVQYKVIARHIESEDISAPYEMTLIKDAKVSPVITYKGKQLKLGKDFTLKEGSNIDAKGKYTGAVTAPEEKDATTGKVTKEAETRTMTVTGTGNFRGTREIEIKVVDKASAKQLTIQIDKTFKPVYGDDTQYGYLFSGTPKMDANGNWEKDANDNYLYNADKKIKVFDKKSKTTELTEGTDFEVVYTSNADFNAGAVKFTVVGIGGYTGNVSKSFKISPKKADGLVAGINLQWDYEKKAFTKDENPEVTYTNSKAGARPYVEVGYTYTTKEGTTDVAHPAYLYEGWDYKVSYSKNKAVGTAAAKISFIGNYKGTKAVTVPFTIVGDVLNDCDIKVPDMSYSKAGKSYVSKPIVEYNGTILKASEYTASYEWASISDIKLDDKYEETGYTKDDKVKVTLKGSDICAKVRVTVTPNAKKSNFRLDTVKQGETEVAVPFVAYYYVTKADGAIDLSKAKVEFYSKVTYDKASKTATYSDADKLKAVQFCRDTIWTPSVEDYEYETGTSGAVKKADDAVYLKVTVNKAVVDPALYDVTWICNYNAGKATVVITGKQPQTTAAPAPADESGQTNETSTGDSGSNTTTVSYAAGGKTVTVKIDPIKKWIEPTKVTETVTNILKKFF